MAQPQDTSAAGTLRQIADRLGSLPERLAQIFQGSVERSPAQQGTPKGEDGGGAKAPRSPDRWQATSNLLGAAGPFVPQLGHLAQWMNNLKRLGEAFKDFQEAWRPQAREVSAPQRPGYEPSIPKASGQPPLPLAGQQLGERSIPKATDAPPIPLAPAAEKTAGPGTYPVAPDQGPRVPLPEPPRAPADVYRLQPPAVPAPVSPAESRARAGREPGETTAGGRRDGSEVPALPTPPSTPREQPDVYRVLPPEPPRPLPALPMPEAPAKGRIPESAMGREATPPASLGRATALMQQGRPSSEVPAAAAVLGGGGGDAVRGSAGADGDQTRRVFDSLKDAVVALTHAMRGGGDGEESGKAAAPAATVGRTVSHEVTRKAPGGKRGGMHIDDFSRLLGNVLALGKALE